MSARRGEVPFVASRVGRSNDPKEVLGLAAELKIARAHALGLVILWEEMIFEVGDATTGKVVGYTTAHVAAKLGWAGKADRLIAALTRAGVFARQRNTFRHPYWRESITGHYANARAEQRADWAEKKRLQRLSEMENESGRPGDVPQMSQGHPGDFSGKTDIKKERTSPGQPPQPPAEAGGAEGASRWRWVLENHPRVRNSKRCIEYLDAMTDDYWALFQWVTSLATQGGRGGASYSLSKKRVLKQNTHQILANEAFLEFLPEWREKLALEKRPKNGTATKAVPPPNEGAEKAARLSHAVAFVLAQLDDPDLSAKAKDAARARFRAAHPDTPPPWELTADLPPAETTH